MELRVYILRDGEGRPYSVVEQLNKLVREVLKHAERTHGGE